MTNEASITDAPPAETPVAETDTEFKSSVLPVEQKLFIVDEDVTEMPMLLKQSTVLVTHFFKRAQDSSIAELVSSIVRQTETKTKGKETFTYEEDRAYAGHFFEIISK